MKLKEYQKVLKDMNYTSILLSIKVNMIKHRNFKDMAFDYDFQKSVEQCDIKNAEGDPYHTIKRNGLNDLA